MRRAGMEAAAVLVVSTGLIAASVAGEPEAVAAVAIALVVTGILVTPALTLAHELGHALAALALTSRSVAIHMGAEPALARLSIGRLAVRLSPTGYTARCDIAGPTPSPARLAIIALAGPAASLAIASILAGFAIAVPGDPGSVSIWVLGLAAGVSLVLALANLVPRPRPGGPLRAHARGPTDGWLALRGLRQGSRDRIRRCDYANIRSHNVRRAS